MAFNQNDTKNMQDIWNGPVGQNYRDQGIFSTYDDMAKWFDSNSKNFSVTNFGKTESGPSQQPKTTWTSPGTNPTAPKAGQIATPWTQFTQQPGVGTSPGGRAPSPEFSTSPGFPTPAFDPLKPVPWDDIFTKPKPLPEVKPGELPEGYKIPKVDWSKIGLNPAQFDQYMQTNNATLSDLYLKSGFQGQMDFRDFTALMLLRNGGANLPTPDKLTYEQLYGLLGDSPAYYEQKPVMDWATQIPGILNDLIGETLTNGNPNAVDLTSLWFADIIANTPNLSRAYTENMNQFIEGTNNRIENTEAFFNAMMGQYGQAGAEAAAAYQKLQGQGDAQIAALGNLIQTIGPDFAASLARQQGDYRQLQAAMAQLANNGTVDYNDFISKFENALTKQEGEYSQFQNQGNDLYKYIMENYGKTKETADQATQAIFDAYNRILTGEVSDASKGYIDEIFKHNQDLINQNFDETMEAERRQLVDNMAGRGILTSGVTGRAYNDITEAALKEKQRSMSEIAAQRAATMLEMPFKQAEYANQLNQHVDTLRNLTSSEATDLMNILQTQYGMSRENAALALSNITAQANLYKDKQMLDQNQMTNMTNLFRDNYNLEQGNLTNKYGQMNTAHSTQADVLNAMMGHDSAYHATAANRLASQGSFGNQNLQLQQQMAQSIPDSLAKMFDQYGTLSRDFLDLMLKRELGYLNAETQQSMKPDQPNPVMGLIGAGLGGGGCVRKGTMITMADGSKKKAEDVVAGDRIKSFDHFTNSYTVSTIEHVHKTHFTHYYRTQLLNGATIEASSYHPFLIFHRGKYKFGVVKYAHAIKNIIKHVFTNPTHIVDSIKFSILALKRYRTLKPLSRVMLDGFNNSIVKTITKVTGADEFFNYRTVKNDAPTFIANGFILEALYEETEKFVKWVSEEGESFDRG